MILVINSVIIIIRFIYVLINLFNIVYLFTYHFVFLLFIVLFPIFMYTYTM